MKYLPVIILLFFILSTPPVSSHTIYLLPFEEERVEVYVEGLEHHSISIFLIHPHGRRETLSIPDPSSVITIPIETGGDYRLYGEYIHEDSTYRAKTILSSPGRERTYSEGLGGSFLEILPQQPPEEMKKDRTFTGKIVRYGVAVEGVLLEVLRPDQELFYVESDREGRFQWPLKRPGSYTITGTLREGVVHRTSYTFFVEDDTRERAIQHYFYLFFLLLLFFYILFRHVKRVFGS